MSSTLNLKESTTLPVSSVLPTPYGLEDDATDAWPEQVERGDFDSPDEFYKQEKPSQKYGRVESNRISTSDNRFVKPSGQTQRKDSPKYDSRKSQLDDYLDALLQVNFQ